MGRGRHQQSADRTAEFRRLIDEAKERCNLSDVIGRYTNLKKRGPREVVGLCPFHNERTASFEVNDAKGTYHCHGCGASGDHFTFLKAKAGMGFREIYEALTNDTFPTVSPEDRARQRAEDERDRLAAISEARDIWSRTIAVPGTPAETYLLSRGITMPAPPSIRFGMVYSWRDDETGEVGPDRPAMIGSVVNGAGEIVAVQRIFLAASGRRKANMRKPKLSLGRVRGGALRLDPVGRQAVQSDIIICEGPEDGLTLAQAMPEASVWVALGTAMMPEIEYPPQVTAMTIAGQNDDAGRAAVAKAQAALVGRGFAVSTIWPAPEFKDWNDQLRGIRC